MAEGDSDSASRLAARLDYLKEIASKGGGGNRDAAASMLGNGIDLREVSTGKDITDMRLNQVPRDVIYQTDAGLKAIMETYGISKEEAKAVVASVIDPRLSLE